MSGSNFTEGVENTPPPCAVPGAKKPSAFRVKGLTWSLVVSVNSKPDHPPGPNNWGIYLNERIPHKGNATPGAKKSCQSPTPDNNFPKIRQKTQNMGTEIMK